MADEVKKDDLNIVVVGHVDHGKSTVIGRLMADTDSLPDGKLEFVRELCRKNAKPFEYAFLLDALKDERSQGITIDAARCFFKTKKRNYTILDAPGHIEFLKNMITGASRAQAALLIIDAGEGVQENSRRHGYMLSMLSIRQVTVVINKMDLVDFSREIFESIRAEYTDFLKKIGIVPAYVLPVSGFYGDNIAVKSPNMPWFSGMTILETLDSFKSEGEQGHRDLRMPVQDVYKFTRDGDDRRIVAGTIEAGSINVGDDVMFFPSGKKSRIKSIESFPPDMIQSAVAGTATGVTLEEQIYITRGEIMTATGGLNPHVSSRIEANIFWLGKNSLQCNRTYFLKVGSEKVKMSLEKVIRVINSSDLNTSVKDKVDRNEVAECILKTEKSIAFDTVEVCAATSRFVIVDQYEIEGGGIITKALDDDQSRLRDRVMLRNSKWESSLISREQRSERYCQKPILMILTGGADAGKKDLAKAFEKFLVDRGRMAYYLGIGTFLYGVDSDMKMSGHNIQEEHIRRFAEVANLMLDAGLILIVTARNMTQQDMNIMKTVIAGDIDVMWVGATITTDIEVDIQIKDAYNSENITRMTDRLMDKQIIFRG